MDVILTTLGISLLGVVHLCECVVHIGPCIRILLHAGLWTRGRRAWEIPVSLSTAASCRGIAVLGGGLVAWISTPRRRRIICSGAGWERIPSRRCRSREVGIVDFSASTVEIILPTGIGIKQDFVGGTYGLETRARFGFSARVSIRVKLQSCKSVNR